MNLQKLALQSGGALVVRGGGAALKLVAGVIAARLLPVRGFGELEFAISLLEIGSVVALLGMDKLVLRDLSRGWDEGAGPGLDVVRKAFLLNVAAATILWVAAVAWYGWLRPGSLLFATVTLVGLIPLTASRLSDAVVRASGRVVTGQVPLSTLQPAAFGVLLLLMVDGELGGSPLRAAGLALLGSYAVAGIVHVFLLAPRLREAAGWSGARKGPGYRDLLIVAGPMLLTSLIHTANAQVDTLMLGTLGSLSDTGYYRAAYRIALAVSLLHIAVVSALGPRIAPLWQRGDREGLQVMLTRTTRATTVLTTIIVAGLGLLGTHVLGLFGPAYADNSLVPLWILMVGQIANVSAGAASLTLTLTGYQMAAARGVAVGLVVNFLLNVLLIPPLGAVGAATASAVSVVVWNLILTRQARALLGVDPSVFGRSGNDV